MTGLTTENALIRNASDVEDFARGCFLGSTGDQVGVELEFLVFDRTAPALQVPMARISDALPPLPGGSKVTFEPGGQLELSGTDGLAAGCDRPPRRRRGRRPQGAAGRRHGAGRGGSRPAAPGPAAVAPAPVRSDGRVPRRAVRIADDVLDGVDPGQPGPGRTPAARWERAHLLGPVLVAAFANSPLSEGRPRGWMSGRQAVWERLDPTRTAARPRGRGSRRGLDRLPARRPAHARARRTEREARSRRPVHDGSTLRDRLGASAHPLTTDGPGLPRHDALPSGTAARLAGDPLPRRPAPGELAGVRGGDPRSRDGRPYGRRGDGRG